MLQAQSFNLLQLGAWWPPLDSICWVIFVGHVASSTSHMVLDQPPLLHIQDSLRTYLAPSASPAPCPAHPWHIGGRPSPIALPYNRERQLCPSVWSTGGPLRELRTLHPSQSASTIQSSAPNSLRRPSTRFLLPKGPNGRYSQPCSQQPYHSSCSQAHLSRRPV